MQILIVNCEQVLINSWVLHPTSKIRYSSCCSSSVTEKSRFVMVLTHVVVLVRVMVLTG